MPEKKQIQQPSTQIQSDKVKSINWLLNTIEKQHPDLKIPKHALLIGAGCSLQCGIPLGNDIIELCKMHVFLNEESQDASNILDGCRTNKKEIQEKIIAAGMSGDLATFIDNREKTLHDSVTKDKEFHLSRLKTFLKKKGEDKNENTELWKEYRDSIIADGRYGFWMNQYSENEEDRQRFIEEIIDDRQPDGSYIILSYLIEKQKFTNILTTNFDDLINEAVMYYTEQRCRFYVDDELSQYISIHSKKPNIVKLHGDYRFANMKNTSGETERLTNNISLKLKELLRHLGLIIIGYNGADYSIMNVMHEYKEEYKYPLIWCGMDKANVHWRVAHLINNTHNSFFVEIKGFDWLMGQLTIRFLSNVPNIVEKAKEKKKVIDKFLERFKVRFEESGGSPEEVQKLDNTMDKWAKLNRAVDDKDYNMVIALEKEIITNGNAIQEDYLYIGWGQYNLKLYEDAIESFNTAVKLDPNDEIALNSRANTYFEINEYKKAIDDYTKAIKIDSNYSTAYFNRGNVYYELKKLDKAITDYTEAIRLEPNEVLYYRTRGDLYYELNEHNNAIEDFSKVIQLGIKELETYHRRAYSYFILGKYNEAIQDLENAIELDPKNAHSYCYRGSLYKTQMKLNEAKKDLDRAIELDPTFWQAYEARAELYQQMNKPRNAKADQTTADRIKKKEAESSTNTGDEPNLA